MKYIAPDGHIMVSNGQEVVTYTCNQTGMVEGIFHSLETKSSGNAVGIEQLQITRVIDETSITISIKESTLEELIAYQEQISNTMPDGDQFNINDN
jgi:outer membrane lipoprotein-sorting protein